MLRFVSHDLLPCHNASGKSTLDPRAALDRALFKLRRARPSPRYAELGRRVSVRACADPALLGLRETLTRWLAREVGA
jgi:hypothetical protein